MKKLLFSISCSLLLCVLVINDLSAQTPTNRWQEYTEFGSGNWVNETISWQGYDYAATSQGMYYRRKGVGKWKKLTKTNPITTSADANFRTMYIDVSDGNRLRVFSTWKTANGNTGSTLWYIVRSVPTTLVQDRSSSSIGLSEGTPNGKRSLSFILDDAFHLFSTGARTNLTNIVVNSKYLNDPSSASDPTPYKNKAKRYPYTPYGYVYSSQSGKPGVLLGGDGFVMRSGINNNLVYWEYIDKGFDRNCGKITAMDTGYGNQREYRNSKNKRSHFVGSINGHVYRGIGNGNAWVRFDQNLPRNTRIWRLKTHGEWLYAATSKGLYVTKVESTDKGFAALKADWKKFGDLPTESQSTGRVMVLGNMVWVFSRRYVYYRLGKPPYN